MEAAPLLFSLISLTISGCVASFVFLNLRASGRDCAVRIREHAVKVRQVLGARAHKLETVFKSFAIEFDEIWRHVVNDNTILGNTDETVTVLDFAVPKWRLALVKAENDLREWLTGDGDVWAQVGELARYDRGMFSFIEQFEDNFEQRVNKWFDVFARFIDILQSAEVQEHITNDPSSQTHVQFNRFVTLRQVDAVSVCIELEIGNRTFFPPVPSSVHSLDDVFVPVVREFTHWASIAQLDVVLCADKLTSSLNDLIDLELDDFLSFSGTPQNHPQNHNSQHEWTTPLPEVSITTSYNVQTVQDPNPQSTEEDNQRSRVDKMTSSELLAWLEQGTEIELPKDVIQKFEKEKIDGRGFFKLTRDLLVKWDIPFGIAVHLDAHIEELLHQPLFRDR